MVSIFHRLGLNLSWRSVWTREMKTFENPLPCECIQPRYIGDIYLQIPKNIGPTEQGRYMVCQLTFDISRKEFHLKWTSTWNLGQDLV